MNIESLIKFNIANDIVHLMLKEAGFVVKILRNNDLLDCLINARVNRTEEMKRLLCAPSFVVLNDKRDPILLSVKFQSQDKPGRNIEWGNNQLSEYWPNSKMLIVTNAEPFFFFMHNGERMDIQKIFKINKKLSNKYAQLVKKFL